MQATSVLRDNGAVVNKLGSKHRVVIIGGGPGGYEAARTAAQLDAEVILIEFDENQIKYTQLLDVFFATHDPTTLNRQGNDVGTQYRSVIYYLNDEQQQQAQQAIDALKTDSINVVTELSPTPTFYPAEDYHQNFFAKNPTQGYCNFAIPPKLDKLRSKFTTLLKTH